MKRHVWVFFLLTFSFRCGHKRALHTQKMYWSSAMWIVRQIEIQWCISLQEALSVCLRAFHPVLRSHQAHINRMCKETWRTLREQQVRPAAQMALWLAAFNPLIWLSGSLLNECMVISSLGNLKILKNGWIFPNVEKEKGGELFSFDNCYKWFLCCWYWMLYNMVPNLKEKHSFYVCSSWSLW